MQLANKRIFLVEDNIGSQAIAKTLLEAHGAIVAVQRNGQNILAHIEKFQPIDLIIIDLMLPNGITGYDIFSMVRNQQMYDDVPIIAMSAGDRSVAVPQAKKRGFSGFISKPIKFQDFPDQIAKLIAGDSIW